MPELNASIRLNKVTFSDSSEVDLTGYNLIIIVGPNNSGKSVTLKEIETILQGLKSSVVLKEIDFSRTGKASDISQFIDQNFKSQPSGNNKHYSIHGKIVFNSGIENQWQKDLGELTSLFVTRLSTDDRLSGSNPVNSLNYRVKSPLHPIHYLQNDASIELAVSNYFQKAFGSELIVDRFAGSMVGLLVGDRPSPKAGEDRLSASFREELDANTYQLNEQGDGMRAFATISSSMLGFGNSSVLLVDEPEAFLHPPQVRLLGEFFANISTPSKQVFVATHSQDFLNGALSTNPESILVLRIEREGDVNHALPLNKDVALSISKDSVMKHTSLLSGIFHQRVIITESDADSMFFNAILDDEDIYGNTVPDVHFVHSGGKHRMPSMCDALKNLGVQTDVIVDIDALNDDGFFRKLYESCGGKWHEISKCFEAVSAAIGAIKGISNTGDLQKYFQENILSENPVAKPDKKHLREIKNVYSSSSAWGQVKKSGVSAIPNGQPTNEFNNLNARCKAVGIWLIKVGEIEGFCRSVGGHGPKWVQTVLDEKDVAKGSELAAARDFMKEIWES